MWHTPHACTRTSASPGPGSGTTTVSIATGAPLAPATTPRTSLGIAAPPVGRSMFAARARRTRTGRWSEPTSSRISAASTSTSPRTSTWSIWLCGRCAGHVRPRGAAPAREHRLHRRPPEVEVAAQDRGPARRRQEAAQAAQLDGRAVGQPRREVDARPGRGVSRRRRSRRAARPGRARGPRARGRRPGCRRAATGGCSAPRSRSGRRRVRTVRSCAGRGRPHPARRSPRARSRPGWPRPCRSRPPRRRATTTPG